MNRELAYRVAGIGGSLIMAHGFVCSRLATENLPPVWSAHAQADTNVNSNPPPVAILLPMDMEDEMQRKINNARLERSLPALARDSRLVDIARRRSLEISTQPVLTHYLSDGKSYSFARMLEASRYNFNLAGENLSRTSLDRPYMIDDTVDALMNSPLHRKNMLEPIFSRVGVGYYDSRGLGYYAMIFANPK